MLTATTLAKNGYWIKTLGKRIYSLEELNYFLYHHMDLVYRDFFQESLFTYLEQDLQQPGMAFDLRHIAANKGNTSDFIRYILQESFYYNHQELELIEELLQSIDTMTKAERRGIQGDAYAAQGHYRSALKCYLEILRHRGEEDIDDRFYSNIAYKVGVIYARQQMCKSANSYFRYAYELSGNPMLVRACVYMSLICEDDEELLDAIVRFKVTDDELDSIKQRVRSLQQELLNSEEMQNFSEALKDPAFRNSQLENWKNDYYEMLK